MRLRIATEIDGRPGYYAPSVSDQNPAPPSADAPVDPLFSHAASPFIRTEVPAPVAFASPPDPAGAVITPMNTWTTYKTPIYFGCAVLAYLMVLVGSVTVVQANPTAEWRYEIAVLPVIPASLVALAGVVLVVWVPFSRSVLGRAAYASGSSEPAAYMSGMPIRRAKFLAYALAGLLASIGGLFLTFFTYTGEAAYASGNAYTLFSIAAVVLGGVSLFGGKGSVIGAIFGAFAFRTIGDLLFVFDFDPLWQPLFQGVVLLIAVSLGAFGLFRVRNRLDWFG